MRQDADSPFRKTGIMNRALASLAVALLSTTAVAAPSTTSLNQSLALAGALPGDPPGFPIEIRNPGHYVLTSDLVVPLSVNAIVVHADGVTLDLNGYKVASSVKCFQDAGSGAVSCHGVPHADGNPRASSGIWVQGDRALVRNGMVSGFGGHGVVVDGAHGHVQALRVHNNQYNGLSLAGPLKHARISDSFVFRNGSDGVDGTGMVVERTRLSGNGGSGLKGSASLVLDCTVTRNAVHGVAGRPGQGVIGVRRSLMFNNHARNLGPGTTSMGSNSTEGGMF
jgi:hypothetical protein